MQVRLVQIRRRKSGSRAEKAQVVDVDVVSIGRGTDQTLSLSGLSVALRHAEIHYRSGHAYARAVGNNEVRVQGHILGPDTEQRIDIGDAIRIGHHEIRPVAPGQGEALCLEIEEVVKRGPELDELLKRSSLHVESGILSRRPLSWIAVAAVTGIFLALPLVTGLFEGSWESGEIASVHSFFAEDCKSCHQQGFRRVQDDACGACHAGIGNHAALEVSSSELTETRCASCHIEHNGRAGLAALEQKLCADCHVDLDASQVGIDVANASDFADHHPEFRISLLTAATGEVRKVEWTRDLVERSGVKFNHLRHVGQVVHDTLVGHGRNMQCSDCHVTDAGGRYMQPIQYETHCQSCHANSFDADRPERQALHGDPVQMRIQLREFYADFALRGEVEDPEAPNFLRYGAPGVKLTERQRSAALEWANLQVSNADRFLMEEKGACVYCHEVSSGTAADGGYGIAPVAVAKVWMPGFVFDHESHAPFACKDCHAAAAAYDPNFAPGAPRPVWSRDEPGKVYALFDDAAALQAAYGRPPSERSSDVLLPGIDTCRDCHGGARAASNHVASDCALCHSFHRDEHGTMREARTGLLTGGR